MVAAADSEDAALVAGLVRRDHDAMAKLYDRHAAALFNYARCTLGQRPLAEEVVQDVFVQLWKRPERFDSARGSVRAYLLTLARGRSIDVARSETARRRREQQDRTRPTSDSVDPFASDPAPIDDVHDALAQLSDEQREAIGLAYYAGLPYREVAAFLDVPEGTVKNRIRTGLARLRDELASPEPELLP